MNGSNNDKLFKRLLDQIDESMTKNQRELCARMDEFFSRLTEVSTKMLYLFQNFDTLIYSGPVLETFIMVKYSI